MTDTELSTTTPTPGPWRINYPHDDFSVVGPDNFRIANCSNPSRNRNAPSDEPQRANAVLIAAAPEMLGSYSNALASSKIATVHVVGTSKPRGSRTSPAPPSPKQQVENE